MRVDNNTSLNFGKITISDRAMIALFNRVPGKQYGRAIQSIKRFHEQNPINIFVDTLEKSNRLKCSVSSKEDVVFQYTEKESWFDKLVSSPLDFIRKVCYRADDFARYLKQIS